MLGDACNDLGEVANGYGDVEDYDYAEDVEGDLTGCEERLNDE